MDAQYQNIQTVYAEFSFLEGCIRADGIETFNDLRRTVFGLPLSCDTCLERVIFRFFGNHWLEKHQQISPMEVSDDETEQHSEEKTAIFDATAQYYISKKVLSAFVLLIRHTNADAIERLNGARDMVLDIKMYCEICRRGVVLRSYGAHWVNFHDYEAASLDKTDNETDGESPQEYTDESEERTESDLPTESGDPTESDLPSADVLQNMVEIEEEGELAADVLQDMDESEERTETDLLTESGDPTESDLPFADVLQNMDEIEEEGELAADVLQDMEESVGENVIENVDQPDLKPKLD